MNSEKDFKYSIRNIIPKYAYFPLGLMLTINMLAYYGTGVITKNMTHYSVEMAIDRVLPLVPIFVVPYFLAYVQWLLGFIRISHVGKGHCYYILGSEMVAKVMAALIFILFPTIMYRPEVVGNDIFSVLTNMLYRVDRPINLFPSIHCVESWMCLRGCLGQKSIKSWFRNAMAVATILVFASTLLIKQHVVLDVVGAVAVCEIALLIVRRCAKRTIPVAKGPSPVKDIPAQCLECLYNSQKKRSDNEEYLREVRRIIDERADDDNAPILAGKFDRLYEKYYGTTPSLKAVKTKYNDFVISIEDDIRMKIEASEDPLTEAMLYARVGNYIDFSAVKDVSVKEFLSLFEGMQLSVNDSKTMDSLVKQLERASTFLLIADNCGEIVLDKLFIEQLLKRYPHLQVSVMVRGEEVQNDVTLEDAYYVGMDRVAKLISNGNGYAGTTYKCLSDEAKEALDTSDVILAKGQANYETSNGQGRHIFYSFLCKCDYFTEVFGVAKFTGMLLEENHDKELY